MKKLLYSILAVPAFILFSSAVCYADAPPVPEPATMWLLGTGVAGLVGYTLLKNRKK